jgi:hypothetical protein
MKDHQLSIFDLPDPEDGEKQMDVASRAEARSKARRKADEIDTWAEWDLEDTEAGERDRILKSIRKRSRELTNHAFEVAARISRERGMVTSTEVLLVLRLDPEWRDIVAEKDARFMGVVFRRNCWTRMGFDQSGSHGRMVSIWRLKAEHQGV